MYFRATLFPVFRVCTTGSARADDERLPHLNKSAAKGAQTPGKSIPFPTDLSCGCDYNRNTDESLHTGAAAYAACGSLCGFDGKRTEQRENGNMMEKKDRKQQKDPANRAESPEEKTEKRAEEKAEGKTEAKIEIFKGMMKKLDKSAEEVLNMVEMDDEEKKKLLDKLK